MDVSNSILQDMKLALPGGGLFSFSVKRDDLIDDVVSGNKWRKLKYSIAQAQQLGKNGVLTFGGAYSNHLVATAKTCQVHGLKSIGIVRGDELNEMSNPTLVQCKSYGMELIFISRESYRDRNDYSFLSCLKNEYLDYYLVPEGGANFYGVIGCQEVMQETENQYDHVFLAAGTATTAAGVLLSLSEKSKLHVVSTLKGNGIMQNELVEKLKWVVGDEEVINELLRQVVFHDHYHFGGYGKWKDELLDVMKMTFTQTQLKLDPIYTGKAFYAMLDQFNKGEILSTENVLFIHTGELQGIKGVEEKIGYPLYI
jgi:1-aminocyclopropane-1-carboxylate deaminase